jgi:DinB superfamily
MPSERAATLADDFCAANADAIAFARSCREDEWAVLVPGEEWSVGVVLHHIAEGHGQTTRWLRAMSSGQGVTDTAADIDRANAAHARAAGSVGPSETITLLSERGAELEALLRLLDDDQLDRVAPFGPAGGQVFGTGELAPVAARHTREHLAHACGALRRQA